jgi:hypothetical protein
MFQKNVLREKDDGRSEATKPIGANEQPGKLRAARSICPGLEQALDLPAKNALSGIAIGGREKNGQRILDYVLSLYI